MPKKKLIKKLAKMSKKKLAKLLKKNFNNLADNKKLKNRVDTTKGY